MRATLPSGAWDCHTHIYGPWEQFPLPKGAAYQPAAAPFDALLAMHERLGIERGVLVQAACYGTDHTPCWQPWRPARGAIAALR